MKNIVLFDLDDTLLDFHKAEEVAVKKTFSQLGIPPADAIAARYSEINRSQWELLEKGELTREQVLLRRFRLLFDELGIPCREQDAQHIYEYLLSIGHYFIDGAEELLQTLYPLYDLYIVSNGTAHVQDGRIASAGIAPYFQDIFISQRVGVNKPDARFFDRCFAAMPPGARERAVIVGDSLTSDIQGGRNAGIRTCWSNPHGKPPRADIPADYEFAALAELPALLKRVFG